MRRYLAVLILCGAPMFGQSAGQKGTGNELVEHCRGAEKLEAGTKFTLTQMYFAGYCRGLVLGIGNMSRLPVPSCGFACASMPEDVTPEQAIQVVQRYLETHPKDLNEADYLLVANAISEAWPAAKKAAAKKGGKQ